MNYNYNKVVKCELKTYLYNSESHLYNISQDNMTSEGNNKASQDNIMAEITLMNSIFDFLPISGFFGWYGTWYWKPKSPKSKF